MQNSGVSAEAEGIKYDGFGINHTIITDSAIWQSGFDVSRHTQSLPNNFQTGKGLAYLHRWGLAKSALCEGDQRQTMKHS